MRCQGLGWCMQSLIEVVSWRGEDKLSGDGNWVEWSEDEVRRGWHDDMIEVSKARDKTFLSCLTSLDERLQKSLRGEEMHRVEPRGRSLSRPRYCALVVADPFVSYCMGIVTNISIA